MFPITIFEFSALPAKKTNILIAYAMWRTLKYSMLHGTEKKTILEEKIKTTTTKSREKTKGKYGSRVK